MTTDLISPDLKVALRRLRLGPLMDTLPERLALARQQKMPHQDFLLLILTDEGVRRDSRAAQVRAQKAHLDPTMQLEAWDPTARVTYDRELLNELASLRFIDAHANAIIVGPVGVGKTFVAHALGHIACRHGHSVLALRADRMLKTLKHSRLDNSYEAELRKRTRPVNPCRCGLDIRAGGCVTRGSELLRPVRPRPRVLGARPLPQASCRPSRGHLPDTLPG